MESQDQSPMRGESYLKSGAGCVVYIGQNLHRLFEHDPEGARWPVTTETRVILTKDCITVCVNDLTRLQKKNPKKTPE